MRAVIDIHAIFNSFDALYMLCDMRYGFSCFSFDNSILLRALSQWLMTINMRGILKLKCIRGQSDRHKIICRKTENVFMALSTNDEKKISLKCFQNNEN